MVRVSYYTDPACPWSWAAEPALRRLQMEFGEEVRITYVMAGMARELGDPLHVLDETLEAAAWSGMPVDPRIWRNRPPKSTYPACQAVKAAAEQSLDGPYLRVLREAILCRRRAMDGADALLDAAREVEGLDLARFELDLHADAIVESLGADLERARGRELPTFVFEDDGREVAGRIAPDGLATGSPAGSVEEVLGRFGVVAAAEVAACCALPIARAQAELWRLAADWRARPERVLTGELWAGA
jgi:predicted DsbA family dithiol-disulfide isomerase